MASMERLTIAEQVAQSRRDLPALIAARAAVQEQRRQLEQLFDAAEHPLFFMPPANHAVFYLEQAEEALDAVISRVQANLDEHSDEEPSEQ